MLFALALLVPSVQTAARSSADSRTVAQIRLRLAWLLLPGLSQRSRLLLSSAFFLLAATGVISASWLLTVSGLAGLGVLSLAHPAIWTAALTFSLPFYFSFTAPILPGRALGLIDSLLLVGLGVASAHWLLTTPPHKHTPPPNAGHVRTRSMLLAALVGLALVSAVASDHRDVALYEWRTVFLSAGLFAILLMASLRSPSAGRSDLWLIAIAWIAGGVVIALAGLAQYASGTMLISAEGVQRIRAFYGSPNNLALYLERTFLVTLSLAAFLPTGRARVAFAVAAAAQAFALALTFSKGALLLGVPAGLLVLWIGGLILLPKQGRSRRPLLWLAAAGIAIVVVLAPFLGTQRFRGLLDFSQGTGYLRLQLWRSSWQMALDHPLLGVGPDNFLYAYRSTYLLPEAWQEPNLNHPHNWLLDWWTRIGLAGLAGAVALFAIGLCARWQTAQACAQASPPEAVLSLGFLAAGVAALAHGLIDASFALPDLMIVWVLILMATIALPERNPARSGSNRSS